MLVDRFNRVVFDFIIEASNQPILQKFDLSCTKSEALFDKENIVNFVKALSLIGLDFVSLERKEPFERNDIIDLLTGIANLKEIRSLKIDTNGLRLKEFAKELSKIRIENISVLIPYIDPLKYKDATSHDRLQTVLDGISYAKPFDLKVSLFSYIEAKSDYADIKDLIKFALSEKIDLSFKEIALTDDFQKINKIDIYDRMIDDFSLAYISKEKNILIDKSNRSKIKINRLKNVSCGNCGKVWILADGTLSLCRYLNDYSIDLNELFEESQSFNDIVELAMKVPLNRPLPFCDEINRSICI